MLRVDDPIITVAATAIVTIFRIKTIMSPIIVNPSRLWKNRRHWLPLQPRVAVVAPESGTAAAYGPSARSGSALPPSGLEHGRATRTQSNGSRRCSVSMDAVHGCENSTIRGAAPHRMLCAPYIVGGSGSPQTSRFVFGDTFTEAGRQNPALTRAPPGTGRQKGRGSSLIMAAPERSQALPAPPWGCRLRRWSVAGAIRKPLLLFRFPAVFLLRLADRRFLGLLFQEPPGNTRDQGGRPGSRDGSNHPPRKIDCRRRQVSACSAWAIHEEMRLWTSSHIAVPARQRSRRPRNRLRKRRTFSSGRHLPAGKQHEPEEGCRVVGRRHEGLVGMETKAAALKVTGDPLPPPCPTNRDHLKTRCFQTPFQQSCAAFFNSARTPVLSVALRVALDTR